MIEVNPLVPHGGISTTNGSRYVENLNAFEYFAYYRREHEQGVRSTTREESRVVSRLISSLSSSPLFSHTIWKGSMLILGQL